MLRRHYLRYLPFCLATVTSVEAHPIDLIKNQFSNAYRFEKTVPVDLKRMAIASLSIIIIIVSFHKEMVEELSQVDPKANGMAYGKVFVKKLCTFTVALFIVALCINAVIFYYSFRFKALGWMAWVSKVGIIALIFGLIFFFARSLLNRKWTFKRYCYDCQRLFLLQGVLPYLLYRFLVYLFPPKQLSS